MKNSERFSSKLAIYLAMSVVMIVGISSCDEGDKEPADYRDAYVGTYTGNESWAVSGQMQSQQISLSVAKSGVSSDRIVITSTFYNYPITESFEAPITKEGNFIGSFRSNIGGFTLTVDIKNGRIRGDNISYTYEAQTLVACDVSANKL